MVGIEEPKVLALTRTFALATWGPFVLTSWRERILATDLTQCLAASRALHAARTEGRVATLAVVDPAVSLPDDATRKLSVQMMDAMNGLQAGSATVLEGDGFRVSAGRAAFAGMTMLSRTSWPQKVFATVQDAAAWLCRLPELRGRSAEELAAAMAALRRRQPA
jgi:hypothetical protein